MRIDSPLAVLFTVGLLGGAVTFGVGLMFGPSQIDSAHMPITHGEVAPASARNPSLAQGISQDRSAATPTDTTQILTATLPQPVRATGDWCDRAKLPSSQVICADPELRAITDERNELYKSVKATLSRAKRLLLDADQRDWITKYATACGVAPDTPPQLPPSLAVRICFRQAGLARNEFLRHIALATPRRTFSGDNLGVPVQQEEIPLRQANGVNYVDVSINGLPPMPFILDSGSADISLPTEVILTLERIGTIAPSDIIGKAKYTLADGRVVESTRFFIRTLNIGRYVLTNVEASESAALAAPLLGQSVLARFGSLSIDNSRHTLILARVRTAQSLP